MQVVFSSRFKRDAKRYRHDERVLAELGAAIVRLKSGVPFDVRVRDHALRGEWAEYRECHLLPDVLLAYKPNPKLGIVTLARIGTHAELFRK